jgi:hypothetical protein
VKKKVVPIVKSSLEMKRKALEFNLGRYKERLTAFERRYGMASEDFAAKFNAGALGDDADWFEWQYLLDAHHETLRQLQFAGRKQQA